MSHAQLSLSLSHQARCWVNSPREAKENFPGLAHKTSYNPFMSVFSCILQRSLFPTQIESKTQTMTQETLSNSNAAFRSCLEEARPLYFLPQDDLKGEVLIYREKIFRTDSASS